MCMEKRDLKDIKQIILHCSSSDFGDLAQITEWHKKRGFATCGYNYIITNGKQYHNDKIKSNKDGGIVEARPLEYVPAHCRHQNRDSIGICLIGTHRFTKKQFEALAILILELKDKFDITKIVPHNYYNINKTCPNFNVDNFLKQYLWSK